MKSVGKLISMTMWYIRCVSDTSSDICGVTVTNLLLQCRGSTLMSITILLCLMVKDHMTYATQIVVERIPKNSKREYSRKRKSACLMTSELYSKFDGTSSLFDLSKSFLFVKFFSMPIRQYLPSSKFVLYSTSILY